MNKKQKVVQHSIFIFSITFFFFFIFERLFGHGYLFETSLHSFTRRIFSLRDDNHKCVDREEGNYIKRKKIQFECKQWQWREIEIDGRALSKEAFRWISSLNAIKCHYYWAILCEKTHVSQTNMRKGFKIIFN